MTHKNVFSIANEAIEICGKYGMNRIYVTIDIIEVNLIRESSFSLSLGSPLMNENISKLYKDFPVCNFQQCLGYVKSFY